MNINLPPNMMPRNNLEASTCKMAEPFNFEKKESKLPPQDSLRSPVAQHNHPNFRLKSPESGNKKNSFLLCEQSKPYLTSQEDNSVISSNPACINGEVCGTKGDRKTLPTGEWELHPSYAILMACLTSFKTECRWDNSANDYRRALASDYYLDGKATTKECPWIH